MSDNLRVDTGTELFRIRLSNPKTWLQRSASLVRCANLLWPSVNREVFNRCNPASDVPEDPIVGVYLMLVGYACESAIKSRIVGTLRRGARNQVMADESLPKLLNSHNIRSLCKTAKIELDSRERELLALLFKMLWRGRYSVPTKAMALTPTYLSTSRFGAIATFLSRILRGQLCLQTDAPELA